MGFVNLQTSFAPLLLLKEMKSKKAQHLRRCTPCNILTQGSSLCSPTLGYQKRNPYGVRQFANFLCAALPFEIAIKSGRRWGSSILQTSFAPIFLLKWLSKVEVPMGFVFFTNPANILCLRPPSPWRGVGGEALMLRLYSKLVFFGWFSLFIRIFHQT